MSETQDAQIRHTIPENIAKPLSDRFVRIFKNSNDGLYYGKRFNGSIELIGSSGPSTDEQVKVSSLDQIAGFLSSKLSPGSNITFTVLNPGTNEQLQINASGGSGFTPAFGHIYSLGDNLQLVLPGDRVQFPNDASLIGTAHPIPDTLQILEDGFYRIEFYLRQSSPSSEVEIRQTPNPSFSTGARFLATSVGEITGAIMYGAFSAGDTFVIVNVGANPFSLADTGLSVNAYFQAQKLG